MTAVAVARGFVSDAMSKIVSSVIGSAGSGDRSSPGSPASFRTPYAWWKATLPPCPMTTTALGSLFAAIASLISLETVAKSGAAAATGAGWGGERRGAGRSRGAYPFLPSARHRRACKPQRVQAAQCQQQWPCAQMTYRTYSWPTCYRTGGLAAVPWHPTHRVTVPAHH